MARARALAVSVMPLENRREQFETLAMLGERLGYDAMLLPETWAYDVTIVLAEAAVKTERIRVGSAILGVWNRSAATLAMGAATLRRSRAGGSSWGSAPARRSSSKACTTCRSARR